MYCSSIKVVIFCLRKACSSVEVYKNLPFFMVWVFICFKFNNECKNKCSTLKLE